VIVSTPAQLAKLHEIAPALPALQAIVHLDAAPAARPQDVALTALLERGAGVRQADPGAFRAAAARVGAHDLATIIYTSGTTGDPKGAMLTHDNIASNVRASLEMVEISPNDRCLSFLPLCHIFERMAGLYAMLAAGASIAYAQNTETVAADAVEVRPTILCGVPRFYEKVRARVLDSRRRMPALRGAIFDWGLARGREKARAHFAGRKLDTFATRLADRLVGSKIRERVGGRLRSGISGGAPLPADVLEFFFAIGVSVLEGYGLTETSPVICLNPPGREKPGSVGLPSPAWRSGSARTARCSPAGRTSCAATTATPRRPRPRSPAAGSTPATSATSTRRAIS
jgi:long-chain acyl-CoA synthetase